MEEGLDEAVVLAAHLHALLGDLDPARWRAEKAAALRQRVTELDARIARLVATLRASAHAARMPHAPWAEFLDELRAAWPQEAGAAVVRERWMAFRARMEPAYEALAAQLRAAHVHVPALRPTNYVRNAFHLTNAMTSLVTIAYAPFLIVPISTALAVWAWAMEGMRRTRPGLNEQLMRAFGAVAHPHETHRVNSATWYTTALVLLAWTQPLLTCALAVTVLGIGDPVAALVGRRYGRTKLVHGRSLEGSLAFLASATLAGFVVVSLWHGEYAPARSFAIALAAAAAGALAELVSLRVDDNLTVPLAAALGVWLVA